MLLAPFASFEPRLRPARTPVVDSSLVPAWLLAWAIAGALALACVPGLRGGQLAGLTLPFWLLGAPLCNILWLTRSRWLSSLGRLAASVCAERRQKASIR